MEPIETEIVSNYPRKVVVIDDEPYVPTVAVVKNLHRYAKRLAVLNLVGSVLSTLFILSFDQALIGIFSLLSPPLVLILLIAGVALIIMSAIAIEDAFIGKFISKFERTVLRLLLFAIFCPFVGSLIASLIAKRAAIVAYKNGVSSVLLGK